MKLLVLLAAASLAALPAFRSAPVAPAEAPASAATTYTVDPVHSAVLFRVKHMGASAYWGRFNGIQGKITVDETKTANCSVSLAIDAASVDTANAKRDDHLRSPDFFNAKQFPTIEFHSTKVSKKGDDYDVEGDLHLLDAKKSVKVSMTKIGESKGREGEPLIGFEGRFKILRSDFGMKYGLPSALGDEVELIVSFEAAGPK